jgi:uncharacterized protein DUF4388
VALKGDIKTVSLAGILQLLSQERKSGTFTVRNEDFHFQTFFVKGSIIYAVESQKAFRLGQLLLNAGLLTSDQLKDSLNTSKEKKQALGKTLLEKGYVTTETIEKYLYLQVQEIMFSMFCLEKGEFHFVDIEIDLRWVVPIQLNTLQLVMDALRRIDDN